MSPLEFERRWERERKEVGEERREEEEGLGREKQDSTLPVRSQIGGENGSRWQCESSITAPQGELQLKLLWSAICQLLRSSRGTREGAISPPISSYPAHNCHVNMCRCYCQNNLRLSPRGCAYFPQTVTPWPFLIVRTRPPPPPPPCLFKKISPDAAAVPL